MSARPELWIREAGLQDVTLLHDFYRQLDPGPAQALSPPTVALDFERYARYPNFRVYLAMVDNTPVGTFALMIVATLAHAGRPFGIVEDVVVSEAARRHGVGRTMMTFAMERCRDARCYKMALSSSSNRVGAHAFYESLGFDRHGYSFLVV